MRIYLVAILLTVASPVFAQQQPLPSNNHMLQVLEEQRNGALTQQIFSEARARDLAEENAKLKTEIEELKKKLADGSKPD